MGMSFTFTIRSVRFKQYLLCLTIPVRILSKVLGPEILEHFMRHSPHINEQNQDSDINGFVLWGYCSTSPPPPPPQLV